MADNRKITVYNDASFRLEAFATPTTNVVVIQGKAPPVADIDLYTQDDLSLLTESNTVIIV